MTREPWKIEKDVVLPATPEQVWHAITTGPGLASWFMSVEALSGGSAGPDAGLSALGEVITSEPGKHFVLRTPAAPDGSFQAFEYLLEAHDGGTTALRFVHSGFQGDDWETEYDATQRGWDMYLHTLGEYLRYFPDRTATSLVAEGPPESAGEQAWGRVPAALGLDAPVTPGTTVRLTPKGLAPIEGIVDYAQDTFLGVRTPDALYRFHGRVALGLPIAVGHHVFAPELARQEPEEAWKAWLQGLFTTTPARGS